MVSQMMKTHKILILILLLSLLLPGCNSVVGSQPDQDEISISGSISYYAALDDAGRKELLLNHRIEITGTVSQDGFTTLFVGDQKIDGICFSCTFSDHTEELEKVHAGDKVQLNGNCTSIIGNCIYLDNCHLSELPQTQPTADTPSATSTTVPTTVQPTTIPATTPTVLPTTVPDTTPAVPPTTAPTTEPTTEPPHTHSFRAATCTTPKTCSCGATEGSANDHSWIDATYASPKTCSVCGAIEGSPLDVPGKENYHGHVYTGGSSSKRYHYEPNCAGKNSHEITWDEVERRNLGPCGTCVLK